MNADKKPIILGSRLQCLILYSLITLEECMTLWGEREQTDIQDTEQLHAHDHHQNVTETLGHTA